MRFLIVNTECQSPTCPTAKNWDEKLITVARPRNLLFMMALALGLTLKRMLKVLFRLISPLI